MKMWEIIRIIGRYRFLAGGTVVVLLVLLAINTIRANLSVIEQNRIEEYTTLAQKLAQMARNQLFLHRYDDLLDLMRLQTQMSFIQYMALEVKGERVLQAGEDKGLKFIWDTHPDPGQGMLQKKKMKNCIYFRANLVRQDQQVGAASRLVLVFKLKDMRQRKLNIYWASSGIVLLLSVLTVVLFVLDQTHRQLLGACRT